MKARLTCLAHALLLCVGLHATEALASSKEAQLKQSPKASEEMSAEAFAKQAVFMLAPITQVLEKKIEQGGTGFLLAYGQYGTHIVTNRHVCQTIPPSPYIVIQQQSYRALARIAFVSELIDLCLIVPPFEIITKNQPYRLSATELKPGDALTIFGHPKMRPLERNDCRFVGELPEQPRLLELSCLVEPGNSGSPTIDKLHKVVGVVSEMKFQKKQL